MKPPPPDSPPILNVDHLCIRRGSAAILQDLSWSVQPGQHWAVLGANGSGKTSLLSALTGYFTPSSGEIHLLGQRYGHSDWRQLRKHVGLVSSALRQRMAETETALETVASGPDALIDFWGPIPTQLARRAARALHQLGCLYLKDRPWAVLSQGERQKVLIARALLAKPSLLILDEPCAGLDPVAREDFLQQIDTIGRKQPKPSLLLVTHHTEEIMPAFTHVLLLKNGRVCMAGPKADVLRNRPLSEAFSRSIRIRHRRNRYFLSLAS